MLKSNKRRNKNSSNRAGITNVVNKAGKRGVRNRMLKTTNFPLRVMKNIHSSRKFQSIKYPDQIQSINASPNFNFTSTTTPYLNLSTIFGIGSFQANITIYNLFRIVGVKVDVQRIINDQEIDTVYTAGTLSPVFIIFTPNFTSTTPSGNELQSSVAFEVDPFVETKQLCSFRFSPILSYNNNVNTTGNVHLFGMWNSLNSNYVNMPGQIGIFPSVTANTASGVHLLYQISVSIDCEFSMDYP
jgi:hypothetical protein